MGSGSFGPRGSWTRGFLLMGCGLARPGLRRTCIWQVDVGGPGPPGPQRSEPASAKSKACCKNREAQAHQAPAGAGMAGGRAGRGEIKGTHLQSLFLLLRVLCCSWTLRLFNILPVDPVAHGGMVGEFLLPAQDSAHRCIHRRSRRRVDAGGCESPHHFLPLTGSGAGCRSNLRNTSAARRGSHG